MGSVQSCCESVRVEANEFREDVKENGLAKAVAAEAAEAAEAAQAAATKFAADAKSGKLQEDMKVAAAHAVEEAKKLVEDAKSGKLREEAAVALAAAQGELTAVVAGVQADMAPHVTFTFDLNGKISEHKFVKLPPGFSHGPQAKPGCCASGDTGKWVVSKVDPTNPQVKDVKLGMVIVKINGTEVGTKKD
ncbi:unnamed protein product, partial [Polarella glacialis]